jgi:hypothetical protein
MTQNFITQLRKNRDNQAGIPREEVLIEVGATSGIGAGIEELGRITCTYKLEIESLEDVIYEENRELEKCYFDPFVKD